ncbi:MAG TPA: LysR family transcriptional regulator [Burkholderiaceae bacterium]|jgi:DNA-binding transcriptional LysR family regulator
MNLTWLEDFLALAASGNFSRAADERHMTQPAFSRRIRALEEWLDVALFDRSSQPATLTDAGRWFLDVAQDTLTRVARLPDAARAVASATSATLRFAATHALSLTFLPAWLRGLEAHTPIGPIQLVSDVLQHCEALMQQGRAQFMLCHAHERVPGRLDPLAFKSLAVGTDALIPVSAPDSRGKPRHTLKGARVPLLEYSAESGLGRLVRALRGPALGGIGAQVQLEPVFTAHLATVLRTMALHGRGIAWLPHSLIEEDLQQRRLVQAAGAAAQIVLEIRLFRRAAGEPPAAEAFWDAVLRDDGRRDAALRP